MELDNNLTFLSTQVYGAIALLFGNGTERDGRGVGAEGGRGRKENRDFQLNVRLLPDQQQQLPSHFADKNRGDGKSGCSKQIVVILAPRKETGRPTQHDTRCRDELTICPRRIFFELANVSADHIHLASKGFSRGGRSLDISICDLSSVAF